MKVFWSKYGSLLLSLVFFALFILKVVSIGSLFDEESAVAGLFAGGYCFCLGDFFSPMLLSWSKKSTDPEA